VAAAGQVRGPLLVLPLHHWLLLLLTDRPADRRLSALREPRCHRLSGSPTAMLHEVIARKHILQHASASKACSNQLLGR